MARAKKTKSVRRRIAVTVVLEVDAPADGVSFGDIDEAVTAVLDREWRCPAVMHGADDEELPGYTLQDFHVESVTDAGEVG